MTKQSDLEQRVKDLLQNEVSGVALFNALFEPASGLFGQMAATETERRALAATPLFIEAHRRVHELLDIEANKLEDLGNFIHQAAPEFEIGLSIQRSTPATSIP